MRCNLFIGLILLASLFSAKGFCETTKSVETQIDDEFKWLDEESVVWSASKFEQKVSEAPSLVSIITSDQIRKSGYRNLMEILESVSGIYGTYNKNYHLIGVRGFGRPGDLNTKVLLLVDGHRINDNIFYQAYVGNDFPVDIDLIERVEVSRGPGSCLYGTNSFFGVINVITRKGEKIKGPETSMEVGTHESFKGRVSFGGKISEDFQVLASGTVYRNPGEREIHYKEFDDASTGSGIAENLDGESFEKYFLKTSFRDFSLFWIHGSRKKDVPTAPYDSPFNVMFNTVDERSFLELKFERRLFEDTMFFSRVYYDRYNYRGLYPYDDEDIGMIENRDDDISKWFGGELRMSRKFFGIDTFTFGAEYLYNTHQDLSNYDDDPYYVYVDDKATSKAWAVYVQNELKWKSGFIINAGLRYDHYDFFGGTLNPRIALIVYPYSRTALKLLYGTAFRAPDLYEELVAGRTGETGLDPEKIKTWELVLEQNFTDMIQGYVSGFYYAIDGLISDIPFGEDDYTYANTDDIEAKGIEAEIRGKLKNGVFTSLNYTFQDVSHKESGKWPSNSPRHMVKARIQIPLIREKLFGTVEGRYMSRRENGDSVEVEDFFILNSNFFFKDVKENLEISLGVYNLLDEVYSDPGSEYHAQEMIEQEGRTFRLKVVLRY